VRLKSGYLPLHPEQVSMSQTAENSGEGSGWTDNLSISSRAAANLEEEYGSADELITAFRAAEDISDVPQVGSVTMRKLRDFIAERDPEANHVRHENDEAICTEFTTDHGLEDTEDDVFYFAFICPRCDAKNPLKGDPRGFKNRPFGCTTCRWVSALESDAIERFVNSIE